LHRLPVILALDPFTSGDPLEWVGGIVGETRDLVSGYKIGLLLALRLLEKGYSLRDLAGKLSGVELVVVDFKLADIPDIVASVIDILGGHGYGKFIIHPFTGGLRELVERGVDPGDLILVASMSHRGSTEFIDKHWRDFVELALDIGVWGVVIGANKPGIIAGARRLIDERGGGVKILSPGVGAQGAEPSTAIKSGGDYEIIGRMVTGSSNPRGKLLELAEAYWGG
jgi:orotidine-5'-phosphate decarboxylase